MSSLIFSSVFSDPSLQFLHACTSCFKWLTQLTRFECRNCHSHVHNSSCFQIFCKLYKIMVIFASSAAQIKWSVHHAALSKAQLYKPCGRCAVPQPWPGLSAGFLSQCCPVSPRTLPCHNGPFPVSLFTIQLSFLKMFSYNVAKILLPVSGHCCLSASSSVCITENLPAEQLPRAEGWLWQCWALGRDLQLLQGAFQLSRTILNWEIWEIWTPSVSLSWNLFLVFGLSKVSPAWETKL